MDRWVRKDTGGCITHVLLNGGILSVDDTRAFHTFYIDGVLNNKKLYVVEQKTDSFRFFIDLDYLAQTALSGPELVRMCHIMCRVLNQSCIVAVCDPRVVGSLVKTGVHIHWPDIHVTKQQALQLRNQILLGLREEIEYDWAKAIDISVYQGSGLRMLWSYKTDAGSTPYKPWKRISPNGTVTDLPSVPAVDVLDLFSIRLLSSPKKLPPVKVVQESADKLESFINKELEGQEETRIHRVVKSDKGDLEVLCAFSDSRYCENIQADHKRNHVWFSIYKTNKQMTIRQRCLDPECEGRSGRAHILPPSIIEELHKDGLVAKDLTSGISIYDLFSIPHSSSRTDAKIH